MSTRGRKPTPSFLKIVDGNPGRRPIREPVIRKRRRTHADRPHLDRDETDELIKKIWKKAIKSAPSGVLTGADSAALYRWCGHYAEYMRAKASHEKMGNAQLIKSPNGMALQHPLIGTKNTQSAAMSRIESELGFTPVARIRLGVEEALVDDDDGPSDYFD